MTKQEKIKFKQIIQGVSGVALFDMYVMFAKVAAESCRPGAAWMRDTCQVELTARLNIIDKGKQ